MQANSTLWDMAKISGNVRLLVDGKAVNGKEFFGSLSQPTEISETYQISRKQALKRARNQVIVAALMGEDRLYRRRE